jgi:hypothetical protein
VDIDENLSNQFIEWVIDWEKVVQGLIEREKTIYEKSPEKLKN